MIVSQLIFADMAGVNKATICKLVKSGKLNACQKNCIDTADAKSIEYLKKHKAKTKPIADEFKDDFDDIELLDDDGEKIDQLTKLSIDIRLKKAQALRHELKYEQDKGLVIPLESVERAAEKVGIEIKTRIKSLPRKLAPRLLALGRSGACEQDIKYEIEKEVDDALEAIKKALGKKIV